MLPTVKVVGAYAKVAHDRYLAGLAVVDGTDLIRPLSLAAPADGDEGRQLEELFRTADDLLAEFEPEQLALKVYEAQQQRLLTIAQRAEGAILAAGGRRGVPVRLWRGASLLRPSGLNSGSHAERVAALAAQVTQEELSDEIERAVAAARASVIELGG